MPGMRVFPFEIDPQSYAQRRADYHSVASVLSASDASRLLAAQGASKSGIDEANWRSLNHVLRRQARFLSWYFFFIACEGLLFGYLATNYGNWKIIERTGDTSRRGLFIRLYNWTAPKLILPHISEWYMLLTDFTWPRHQQIFVRADVLQNDGHLYQGRVADYFIDSAGKLTGILLDHISRFDRQGYLDAKSKSPDSDAVSSMQFWRNIPSQNFYIGQSSISNLNVRFVPRDETLISLAETILDEKDSQLYQVEVSAKGPNSGPPDIYS